MDQPLGVAFEPAGRKWAGALGCGLSMSRIKQL